METKIFIGVIASILSAIGYIPYIWNAHKGKTTPHLYSWIVWTLLNTIIFILLVLEGAGAGAWPIGMTSVAFGFNLYYATKARSRSRIQRGDLSLLVAALAIIPIWLLTTNITAIILVTLIEFLGFVPTFRKTYEFPFEETLIAYVVAGTKYVLVLFALDSYNFELLLNPIMWLVLNVSFIAFALSLRQKHARAT